MFDIKWIRENPNDFDAGLKRRGAEPLSTQVLELDQRRREIQTQLQELQSERNNIAKQIPQIKAAGGDITQIMSRSNTLKESIPNLEESERDLNNSLQDILANVANIPHPEVPDGKDENDNIMVRNHGTPKTFGFPPKRHFEIGEQLGLMDFETAGKISGARFVVTKGPLARLERALAQFMLDMHTQEFGYMEVNPPILVRDDAAYGTGQLPKLSEDMFQTKDGRWLIPTAEVSLTNLVRETILDEKDLPLRFTASTPCFRSEAGAAGKDTRGMIRQHQFQKVELVSIAHPEKSLEEHERMTNAAEEVLKRLELPYRVMLLCAGDMGFCSRKTYDLEVWLPGEDTYREISSCSVCGDFQARRMNARFKGSAQGSKPEYVHTLNGSGLAVGRTLVAILENYQQEDGSVVVPEVLRRYMGEIHVISKNSK